MLMLNDLNYNENICTYYIKDIAISIYIYIYIKGPLKSTES